MVGSAHHLGEKEEGDVVSGIERRLSHPEKEELGAELTGRGRSTASLCGRGHVSHERESECEGEARARVGERERERERSDGGVALSCGRRQGSTSGGAVYGDARARPRGGEAVRSTGEAGEWGREKMPGNI